MATRRDMFEALIAIATIVDDDRPTHERVDGIRGVLAAVGMLRVGMPQAEPVPLARAPLTPAEARLESVLKAHERVARTYPPSSSPTLRSSPPRAKPLPKPPAPKETRKNRRPKPLVDDPERQERIRREFTAGVKRPKKS